MQFVSEWDMHINFFTILVSTALILFTALFCMVAYYSLRYLWELITLPYLKERAVFISGCDSGFGFLLALKLANNGILTFAGCLTKQGQRSLIEESRRQGIPEALLVTTLIDVSDDDSVRAASHFVEQNLPRDKIFWCLVNNAGVFGCFGPDAWTSIDHYKKTIDVNLFGTIRCVHAFLPMLKKYKGRIVTMASAAGRVAFPYAAPYHISKYGVEAYMDSIRWELKPFGVECSILEPGAFRTSLVAPDDMFERVGEVWNRLDPEMREEYGSTYKEEFLAKWNIVLTKQSSTRFHYVVDNYYHAITAMFPRLRYRCGWDAIILFVPMAFMPAILYDFIFKTFLSIDSTKPAAVALKR